MLLLALALWSDPASAAGFQAKTMRAPLAAVEVERPLIIGRGWLELGIGADYKYASGYWDADGQAQDWLGVDGKDGARWLYTTERLDLRYGIARRADLYWSVPFHYVRLTNESLGTDTGNFGLGDPRFGWRLEWLGKRAPTTSLISELELKLPAGSESAATYIGGPNTVQAFVLSTGTMDAALALKAKQQFGPVAITGGVGYVHRFSGVTQFTLEVDQYQFLGRFKPGDEVRAQVEPMVQLGPVAAAGELAYRLRFVAAAGTTSGGLIPDDHLDPIEGTDGWALDVTPKLTVNVTRGVDVKAAVGIPLRGEDVSLFPLELLTPTRGLTWSGQVLLRY